MDIMRAAGATEGVRTGGPGSETITNQLLAGIEQNISIEDHVLCIQTDFWG